MKKSWVLAAAFAMTACAGGSGNDDKIAKKPDALVVARTEIASAAYLTALSLQAVDGFAQAASAAAGNAGAPAFRPQANDAVYPLAGELTLDGGGKLTFDAGKSNLTRLAAGAEKLLVKALQRVSGVRAGDFDVSGEIAYAADLTYSSGGLYGDLVLSGTLTLAGDETPVKWTAAVAFAGARYTFALTVADGDKEIGKGKTAELLPLAILFYEPPVDHTPTQVCGTTLTTANYVASVTAAQSAGDFLSTNEAGAMGSPISDTTICFRPIQGGGYDIYAARTNDYPLRPVTGATGPTSQTDPRTHYLANDFRFYGVAQTAVVVNASGSLLFDPASPLVTNGYLWPWFLDGEYGIVGSSWDARDGYSTYSFLITETTNELVVSASAAAAGSYTGRGDLQMILKLDTNEIIFNYGRYDMFGIAPGIYAGSTYSQAGAFKLVEYIDGTGLSYSPY
jgi:hypothetical protein